MKVIVGTDVSLEVCRSEGYWMMEYDDSDIFRKHVEYRVFYHYPEYIKELDNQIRYDEYLSFNELEVLYLENKKACEESCETHIHVNFIDPTYHDFLNLVNDISFVTELP